MFAAQDYSPERIAVRYKEYASGRVEGFVRAYADILAEGTESFRRVLEWVREGDGVGLVHCTAGKDRYVGCGFSERRVLEDGMAGGGYVG